jgi:hypothetical protein
MGDRVDIESFDDKVVWTRPNNDRICMTVDEFHEMFELSKVARFTKKYPRLADKLSVMDTDVAVGLVMEIFNMSDAEAEEIVNQL